MMLQGHPAQLAIVLCQAGEATQFQALNSCMIQLCTALRSLI